MDESTPATTLSDLLVQLLGYLNFSEGKADGRFEQNLSAAFALCTEEYPDEPWQNLHGKLMGKIAQLQSDDAPAFRNVDQAKTVISLTFEKVLPAYREFHKDLLFHLSDEELLQPFFLARVMEAVLQNEPRAKEADALVQEVIKSLNDYVGHRPVAILENRPKGEPYEHERLRPIPLYIKDAGVATGKYHDLIRGTMEILNATDPAILSDAHFHLEMLEELAVDPRAYDHGHPCNRRPNYMFGEWDPHAINGKGFFHRFVIRKLTLDAILERVENHGDLPKQQILLESATVLAGVILMSTGVSGYGPETHDSSVTLASLVPRIARCRDAFYNSWLHKISGSHGLRLQDEAKRSRQPFGGARQYLNQYMARHRASQLQNRHLAMLLAEMGYPEASRRQAAKIPATSIRMVSEIHIRLTTCKKHIADVDLEQAVENLDQARDLLLRGIACGALVDPWNILGFGGLFPLFMAMEDSVRDPRIDELVGIVEQMLNLYSELLSESAATGNEDLTQQIKTTMKTLSTWWDQFATHEVNEVQRVHGEEISSSAEHVSNALRLWHERGEAPADLGFWREHLESFQSPKAFAMVVDTLLRKEDYRAAMGLLMHWLSMLHQVPLEDNDYSFHVLGLRWMLGVCQSTQNARTGEVPVYQPDDIVIKFFDYLEANADEYWNVPNLEVLGIPIEEMDEDLSEEDLDDLEDDDEEETDLYGAAYEGMSYQDSTDDDVEGEVLEVGMVGDFDLEIEGERIEKHLRFLSTVARLWNIATRTTSFPSTADVIKKDGPLSFWLKKAMENNNDLLYLLDSIHEHPIPDPSGNYDSLVEFDRRRVIKDRLLHVIIATCLDNWLAVSALRGRCGGMRKARGWKAELYRLEEAMWHGNASEARIAVESFLNAFKQEPLLFTPLSADGHPRQILRASRAQTILRAMVANLPRVGLLAETHRIVQMAHEMEQRQPLQGQRVTEFDRLFQVACQAATEAVVAAANADPSISDESVVLLLEKLIHPYLPLWREHSRTLRVAMLEVVSSEAEWRGLTSFIKTYGRELFHVRFLTLGNLRGILHRGIGNYLAYLQENEDPMHPSQLLADLDKKISRMDAERYLRIVMQTIIENYESYKDYNATAPQSDYGENLFILLDFLRIKASYDRQAWQFRPLVHVHEILARERPTAALAWQERFTQATAKMAEQYLAHLTALQKEHGIAMNTVSDRLQERFVKPLALDRLCALIEPTMNAAYTEQATDVYARFEAELKPYSDNPTGVGLDMPQWLQRLEGTLKQIDASKTELAGLAENLLQIPKVTPTINELRQQLGETSTVDSKSNFWNWMTALLTPTGQSFLPGPLPPKT